MSGTNPGDGNGDGIPDNQQDGVASLPDSADGRYITLAAGPGIKLDRVAATARERRQISGPTCTRWARCCMSWPPAGRRSGPGTRCG